MRWLKIDAAENRVLNAELWAGDPPAEGGVLWLQSETGGPGDLYDPETGSVSPAPAEAVVPQLVEMRKAKLEMVATPWPEEGKPDQTLYDVVSALVSAGGVALQIEFGGMYLSRTRDLVVGMQAQLGISDEDMDAMFIRADARP